MPQLQLTLTLLLLPLTLLTACAQPIPEPSPTIATPIPSAEPPQPTASPTPSAHEQGIFHHTRGYARFKQADYNNAVADMDKAQQLIDPQLIHLYTETMQEVYLQSGIAYYDTGEYDTAIILLDKAITVAAAPSDHPEAYYQRGLSYYRKGSYRLAIADFDAAIRIRPTSAAYELRAQAHAAFGNPAQADEDWKKAKELISK